MPIINAQVNAQLPGAPAPPPQSGAGLQAIGPVISVEIHAPAPLVAMLMASQLPIPAPISGLALIDTGASVTCVENQVMQQLGVQPIGVQNLGSAAGQNAHNVYPAKLLFPQNVAGFVFASVVGVNLAVQTRPGLPPIIALVGRDILSGTLFVYNGVTGSFSLAFA